MRVQNAQETVEKFNVYGSVRRESMSITVQQDATIYSLLYFCELLYMLGW